LRLGHLTPIGRQVLDRFACNDNRTWRLGVSSAEPTPSRTTGAAHPSRLITKYRMCWSRSRPAASGLLLPQGDLQGLKGYCSNQNAIVSNGFASRRHRVSPYSQEAERVWPVPSLFLNAIPSDPAYLVPQPLASWPAVPGPEPGQPAAAGFAAASRCSVRKHRERRTDLCQRRRRWRSFELSSWMFSQIRLQKRCSGEVVAARAQRMHGRPARGTMTPSDASAPRFH
jgi:hypothetical protein